jgi:hypothetical protein
MNHGIGCLVLCVVIEEFFANDFSGLWVRGNNENIFGQH